MKDDDDELGLLEDGVNIMFRLFFLLWHTNLWFWHFYPSPVPPLIQLCTPFQL